MILAIDPGTEESAFVVYDTTYGKAIVAARMEANMSALYSGFDMYFPNGAHYIAPTKKGFEIAIEWIESYGMPVGREVFETVYWIGRFDQAFGPLERVTRRQVKLHLCNSPRANDATIRQALIDRFGGTRQKAIGTKKAPGPLYSIKGDLWSALAVAVTFSETRLDK